MRRENNRIREKSAAVIPLTGIKGRRCSVNFYDPVNIILASGIKNAALYN